MDTATGTTDSRPEAAATALPSSGSQVTGHGLGAELRESLVLLGAAVAVTVGLTTAAQAALTVLA